MVQSNAPAEIYQLQVLLLQTNPPIWRRLARAQRQQHRHAARATPDRIRLERLSPPSFRDSRQGVWSEPDRLHHVQDRREESTSFPIPFPRQRALSLRI